MTTDLCTPDVVVHIGGPQIISQSETRVTVGGVGGAVGGGAELGRRLLVAAREGDTATVLDLMAKGTPFATDWLGTSPLHLAASNGHVETCAVLLRAGVSRDSRTKVDRTALHMAAYEGHERVVALLLEGGAQVDCRDMLRMTPLHWAAQRGHVAAARELLRAGADPLAVSKFGGTAVSLARRAPPTARDHMSLVVEEAVRAQEAAHSVHALVSEEDASGARPRQPTPHTLNTLQKIQESNFTQKKTSPIEEQLKQHQHQQEEEKPNSAKSSHTSESRAERERQRQRDTGSGSGSESEGAAALLLRRHGITLLPADESSTVLSALQSGRSVVLSDAGKLMLKESAAPVATTTLTAPAALVATAVKPPAPAPARAGVKIFTLNNNQLVPANTNNSQNLKVKYVQLPTERGGKAGAGVGAGRGRRAAGAPVKIILNRANFTKLLSPFSNSPAAGVAGEASAAGEASEAGVAGEAVAQAESVLRVSEQWVASCSPKQLRAHALHARRALAALLRQYRAARSPRRT